ncbi:sugar ABC transporter ATP-binding protein [Actinoallomurus spadix]|uniref:Sugar ABC transporter ATP-binding protein n=1 Tax=Actinoallomurus spadix TaxID=79912 RepID=A0ABP3FVR4_9ACTN|nr:sugar ABC transporter ATP-binding protein [Actinoallomurus spadix]MCO5986218.1 sugar ABC transporter ATP-binding protein [Actinoallomurus spadix]
MADVALECRDLAKSFGGVPVLKGVSLTLEAGSVTALAGENGAGKSTMMKIASGQVKPDHGQVLIAGEPLSQADPRAAHRQGVAIIPQELAPIMDMKVYENLFIGRELRSRAGLLDRRAMARKAREILDVFEVEIDPQATMRMLPVGLRQLVEIAKSTSGGAKVLLLDEPSSAISDREVERLYTVVGKLREQGVAMLYTTHKMEEIRALADRVVVLRDGRLVTDRPLADISDDDIVHAMIGRELEDLFPVLHPPGDEVALQVSGLHVHGYEQPVELTVRRGEILGLAGLVGAGRTELLEAIFGIRKSLAGTITVAGKATKRNSPADSIGHGMALVPEDRKGSGAVLSMSVLDNGSLPRLSSFTLAGWLRQRERARTVGKAMESVKLRSRGLSQQVGTLSGGNQQKVVLARWLTDAVNILLLDEPTRGVDVGARSEIYRIITELAASGMAVVMASSDMPEILSLAHRALVMREGAVAGELNREDLSSPDVQDTIFRLAAGLEPGSASGRPQPPTDTKENGR